jgi:hypothetical protein
VIDEADIHGQLKFNYKHPHIKNGQESEFVLNAFQRDCEMNGPMISLMPRKESNVKRARWVNPFIPEPHS